MSIIFLERHYPLNKNKEVVAAWLRAIEKYPQPEGLFTTLVDTAVRPDKKGINVFSAYLITAGKHDAAFGYLARFMTEFFDIEGYSYEFTEWATLQEGMEMIGQPAP
jgi:hypothetical protein